MANLQDEIRRTYPFEVPEEEAMLSILRTAEVLTQSAEYVVKSFQLTGTQYNVLRILRGAGSEGLPAHEIASRMITHDPDITRLLQRLESRRLAIRERSTADRRVVVSRITPQGLALLKCMDAPVIDHVKSQLGHLGPRRLAELITLLSECRRNPFETERHLSKRK